MVTVAWWFLSAAKDRRSKLTLNEEKERLACDSPRTARLCSTGSSTSLLQCHPPLSGEAASLLMKTFLLKLAYISQ